MGKSLLLLITLFIVSCNDSSEETKPGSTKFAGKYSFSTTERQVQNWPAMDFLVTITEKNGKLHVNSIDEFADPADMGEASVSGNSLTVKQHVEDDYDTRDITMKVTDRDGFLFMEYDVDFTKASPDFYVEGILTKQ